MKLSKNANVDFPDGPVAKTVFSKQGIQVWSLVRELDPSCCDWHSPPYPYKKKKNLNKIILKENLKICKKKKKTHNF